MKFSVQIVWHFLNASAICSCFWSGIAVCFLVWILVYRVLSQYVWHLLVWISNMPFFLLRFLHFFKSVFRFLGIPAVLLSTARSLKNVLVVFLNMQHTSAWVSFFFFFFHLFFLFSSIFLCWVYLAFFATPLVHVLCAFAFSMCCVWYLCLLPCMFLHYLDMLCLF